MIQANSLDATLNSTSATRNSIKYWLEQIARVSAVSLAFFIPLSNTGTSICTMLFLMSALFSMDRAKLNIILRNPITHAIAIFIGIYLMGVANSAGTPTDIMQAVRKMTRVVYIPLFFPLFTDARWRKAALVAFLSAMLITVVLSRNLLFPLFKDSIFTSLFVAFASFVTMHYIKIYKNARIATVPLLFVLTSYLFFICTGRTGQIIFVALYGLFCWQSFGFKLKYQIIAALILTTFVSISILQPSSFARQQSEAVQELQLYFNDGNAPVTKSSTGGRLTFVKNSFTLIKQKPIFGWGTGAFVQAFKQNISEADAKGLYTENPHNQYVLTWVETGLIGFLALLYMFFIIARVFWKSQQYDAKLGLGLLLAIALGCLANSWLMDFASMFFLVTFAGILGGALVQPKL